MWTWGSPWLSHSFMLIVHFPAPSWPLPQTDKHHCRSLSMLCKFRTLNVTLLWTHFQCFTFICIIIALFCFYAFFCILWGLGHILICGHLGSPLWHCLWKGLDIQHLTKLNKLVELMDAFLKNTQRIASGARTGPHHSLLHLTRPTYTALQPRTR